MDFRSNFEKKLNLISQFNGVGLNIEEKIKLEIGLNELYSECKDEHLNFWGKIIGEESDYYIAQGINFKGHYEFPEKKFYFAPSTFKFELLPETYPYHDNDFLASYFKGFKGNPNLVIKKYKEDVEEGEEGGDAAQNQQDEDNEENKPSDPDASVDDNAPKKEAPKENFTEKLKLSFLIRQIDYDTNIIPAGALQLIPEHELRINKTFKGLKPEVLKNKRSFLHFRPVILENNKKFLETPDAIFSDFVLDSIQDDQIKCSWSVQLDPTKTICNVRSLLWPGYFMIHQANTNIYAGCYIGNGFKNAELSFMV